MVSSLDTSSSPRPGRLALALSFALAWPLLGACSDKKSVEGFPDEFVGVGAELTIAKSHPEVVRTVPGSPAEEVGLKVGDVLTHVAGTATEGMSLGEVVHLLRGRPETQVVVQVRRDGEGKPLTMVMRRRAMKRSDAASAVAAGYTVQRAEPAAARPTERATE